MLAYVFLLFAIVSRLAPHAWGNVPLGASLLFFGAYRSRKQLLLAVPVLIGVDYYLNHLYGYPVQGAQWLIFAWYAGAGLLGSLLKNKVRTFSMNGAGLTLLAALTTSVSFFLVSNFAVWLGFNSYPKTWAGLTTAYVAAIPFFERGLRSDLVYSAVFFSIPVLVAYISRSMAQRRTAV